MPRWLKNAPKGSWRWLINYWWRQIRFLWLRLRRVLTSREIFILAVTHLPILALAWLSVRWVKRRYQEMPTEFAPRGKHLATIIIAVGFQQKTEEAYWIAQVLAIWFNCRVLILRVPPNGNTRSEEHVANGHAAKIAQLIRHDYKGHIPVIGLGFSKGGRDLTALAEHLIEEHGIILSAILTLSTPWRGSGLSVLSRTLHAESLNLSHEQARQWRDRVIKLHDHWGIRYRFFCATWGDRVVLRSNARILPPDSDIGISLPEMAVKWYFAEKLWLQFGHTAFFNPLVWYQMGVEIRNLLQSFSRQSYTVRRRLLRKAAAYRARDVD